MEATGSRLSNSPSNSSSWEEGKCCNQRSKCTTYSPGCRHLHTNKYWIFITRIVGTGNWIVEVCRQTVDAVVYLIAVRLAPRYYITIWKYYCDVFQFSSRHKKNNTRDNGDGQHSDLERRSCRGLGEAGVACNTWEKLWLRAAAIPWATWCWYHE